MSKYNQYAKSLDKALRSVREAYKKEAAIYKAAEQSFKDAKARTRANHTSQNELELKSEEINFEKATEVFKSKTALIFKEYRKTVADLERELREVVENDGITVADDVDMNAMELLKSGVMKSADYANMIDRYSDNATMCRLISKYANEYSKSCNSPTERARVNTAVHTARNGEKDILNAWDSLLYAANVYTGHQKTAPMSINYVSHMMDYLDTADNYTDAIENF